MKHGGQHADAWRIVRELAPTVTVAHHIAGRTRLKLTAGLPAFADGRPPSETLASTIATTARNYAKRRMLIPHFAGDS